MAGYFKLVDAHDGGFRIKIVTGDGSLFAVSAFFETKQAAVAGIDQMRHIAAVGPVVDHSHGDEITLAANENHLSA